MKVSLQNMQLQYCLSAELEWECRVFLSVLISLLGQENPTDHPTCAAEKFSANYGVSSFQLAGSTMPTANSKLDRN